MLAAGAGLLFLTSTLSRVEAQPRTNQVDQVRAAMQTLGLTPVDDSGLKYRSGTTNGPGTTQTDIVIFRYNSPEVALNAFAGLEQADFDPNNPSGPGWTKVNPPSLPGGLKTMLGVDHGPFAGYRFIDYPGGSLTVGDGAGFFVCGNLVPSVQQARADTVPRMSMADQKAAAYQLADATVAPISDWMQKIANALQAQGACGGEATRLPIIFIPGIGGSSLREPDGEFFWPIAPFQDRANLFLNPDGSAPAGVKKVIEGGVIEYTAGETLVYLPLVQALSDTGYPSENSFLATTLGRAGLFFFPYDWRLDNGLHLLELDRKVRDVLAKTGAKKVILISHSMGGLIARAYINSLGKDKVDSLISMELPFCGAPAAFFAVIMGYTFGNQTVNPNLMKVLGQNWPAAYQLFPCRPFIKDGRTGQYLSLEDSYKIKYKWFTGVISNVISQDKYTLTSNNPMSLNPNMLKAAADFRKLLVDPSNGQERSLPPGVNHYVIAGTGVRTLSFYLMRDAKPGEPYVELAGRHVVLEPQFEDGDGTPPWWSLDFQKYTRKYYISHKSKNSSAGHLAITANPATHALIKQILDGKAPDSWAPQRDSLADLDAIDFTIHSDAHLTIVDTATGETLGFKDQGGISDGILTGSFLSSDEAEYASLAELNRTYRVLIKGTKDGKFQLSVKLMRGGNVRTFDYPEVKVKKGTLAQCTITPDQVTTTLPPLIVTPDGKTVPASGGKEPKTKGKLPDLNGTWLFRGIKGQDCTITEAEDRLELMTEKAMRGTGTILNPTTIVADFPFALGLKGTVLDNGKRIHWSNGEDWVKAAPAPSPKPSLPGIGPVGKNRLPTGPENAAPRAAGEDLSGTWVTPDGQRIQVTQQGDHVTWSYHGGRGHEGLTGTVTGTVHNGLLSGTIEIHEGATVTRAPLNLRLDGDRLSGIWVSATNRRKRGRWVMTRLGASATPATVSTETKAVPEKRGTFDQFPGTWITPYNGGECTFIVSPSGSGTETCSGTGGQRENGNLTNCAVQGNGVRCDWRSTYSDADKTITRGGKKNLTLSGDTLRVESTVDQKTIVQNWRNNCPSNDCPSGAKQGGVVTYTRR